MAKHTVRIVGHDTSVSLEDAFWIALKEIAEARGRSINDLVTEIDQTREGNLSSAIRVYVLEAVRGADKLGGANETL